MNPHDFTWLLFASPIAVAAVAGLVYLVTGWQDRAQRHQPK